MKGPTGHRPGVRSAATAYTLLLPFLIPLGLFTLWPVCISLRLSFARVAGKSQYFVGWDNYLFLLRDRLFWGAAANTLLFTIGFLLLEIPLSLAVALLLNHKLLRGGRLWQTLIFLPYLLGPVFSALLFAMLFSGPRGVVGQIIHAAGGRAVSPLAEPSWAMPLLWLAATWGALGLSVLYLLAALRNVDQRFYEAAELDGAGAIARFFHITLPAIRPVLAMLILIGVVASLQIFELPYVLFGGPGPGYRGLSVVMYLYMAGFEAGDLGYASAIGWALAVMILLPAVALYRLRPERL